MALLFVLSSFESVLYWCFVQYRRLEGEAMEANEWVARCSARLHAHGPRVLQEQRDEVAAEIHRDRRWQAFESERAAVEWLRQGMPVDGRSEAGSAPR